MTPLETKPVVESRWQDPLAELGRVLSHCHWDLYLQTTSQDYLGLEICSRGNSRRKTHSNDTGFNFLWKPLNFFFSFLYFAFPFAHIGPHTLCEQVLDHVMNQGFQIRLVGQDVSRPSHQELVFPFTLLHCSGDNQAFLYLGASAAGEPTQCHASQDGPALLQNHSLLLRCRPSVHCGSSTSHSCPDSISGTQSYIQTTAAQ